MEEFRTMDEIPPPVDRVRRGSVEGPIRGAVALVLPILLGLACWGPGGDARVTSSDPRLARIAARILPDLASHSGMELRGPVRVERRSRVELERYLEFKIDEEFPEGRAELLSEVYSLFGLVPRDLDLRSTLKALYLEQIAGFYDPDSTTLFVLDDQPEEAIESLLVHELVHAIQDQNTDLDAITAPGLNNDHRVAAQAAIEGHATLVMFEFMMRDQERGASDPMELPDFSARLGPALEVATTQSPALAEAPLVLQEFVLFPYRGGVTFVESLWRERGGRPAPFGSDLPRSTEQVLHPEKFGRGQRDVPRDIEVSVKDSWSRLYEDTLGELEIGILLETLGASPGSAVGWGGDRYVLLEDGDGHRSLAWFVVWDTEAQRDEFARELEPRLSALPERAWLAALEIGGLPATRLLVGGVPEVIASLGNP
jgi:hypothetical protein